MIDRHTIWRQRSIEIVARRCGLSHLPQRDQLQLLRQLVAERRAEVARKLEATE
ncbi:hypothetical protein CA51_11190 [Rosistilla oblonga]|nr:hypothetical protein CA51_11190 [Rosistilla oblonga]